MIELICINELDIYFNDFKIGKKYKMIELENKYYHKESKNYFTKEPDDKGRSYKDWFSFEDKENIEAEDF